MSLCLSCSICSENYTNNDNIYSTQCGHVFHFHCMQQWQSRSTSCPECRSYNPMSHKIYLNLENSTENEKKLNEVKLELELNKKKIAELEQQAQDVEELVEVKSKLELSIKTSSELEQQLEQTERDFLNLQGQYNLKEDELREVERKVRYLSVQNEFRNKENLSLKAENVALQNAGENPIENISNAIRISHLELALRERINILEEKLKQISLQLSKEITNSTNLTVEKMKLQSILSQYTSGAITIQSNRSTINLPQENFGKTNSKLSQMKTEKTNKNSKPKQLDSSTNEILSLQHEFKNKNDVRSVLVKGIAEYQTKFPVNYTVLKLAHIMELQITEDDIEDASIWRYKKNKQPNNISIVVKFTTLHHKIQFLTNKEKLKANIETRNLILHEFVNGNTNTLFHYAKILKTNGYKFVYCRNNTVFAKKHQTSPLILIKSQEKVDKMMADSKEENESDSKANSVAGLEECGTVDSQDSQFYAIS